MQGHTRQAQSARPCCAGARSRTPPFLKCLCCNACLVELEELLVLRHAVALLLGGAGRLLQGRREEGKREWVWQEACTPSPPLLLAPLLLRCAARSLRPANAPAPLTALTSKV